MRHARWLFWLCWLLVPATARSLAQRTDSIRVLNRAHDAQRHFERIRRRDVPVMEDPFDEPCDAEIGRMCYLHADNAQEPAREPESTSRARHSLISTLARLSAQSPGDNWIIGQLVRYTVEAGEFDRAVSIARACSPPRWYCEALRGYALHMSADYEASTIAYDSALAIMPLDERCRWNDISLLISGDQHDSYERIPCGQRDSVEQRFWTLARPSFLVDANDRRTEHYSRVLLADLFEDADNAYDMHWGSDMRELLIRYGAPVWYSKPTPQPFHATPRPIGHDRAPSYHFIPDLSADSVDWNPYSRLARTRYSPPYLDTLVTLDAQFAMLKRGDSALVVVAYRDSARDSTQRQALEASEVINQEVPRTATGLGIKRTRTAWKPMMVGVETFDPKQRSDARARQWIEPPQHAQGAPEVSTLLLFSADSSTSVESLDDALEYALTSNDLRGTRRLGLYWEVYGDGAADSADAAEPRVDTTGAIGESSDDSSSVVVTVARTDGGAVHRLAQMLHLSPKDSPISVRWHEAHPSMGTASHSVLLDLSTLARGDYRVSVAVGRDPTHRTEIARDIRLR